MGSHVLLKDFGLSSAADHEREDRDLPGITSVQATRLRETVRSHMRHLDIAGDVRGGQITLGSGHVIGLGPLVADCLRAHGASARVTLMQDFVSRLKPLVRRVPQVGDAQVDRPARVVAVLVTAEATRHVGFYPREVVPGTRLVLARIETESHSWLRDADVAEYGDTDALYAEAQREVMRRAGDRAPSTDVYTVRGCTVTTLRCVDRVFATAMATNPAGGLESAGLADMVGEPVCIAFPSDTCVVLAPCDGDIERATSGVAQAAIDEIQGASNPLSAMVSWYHDGRYVGVTNDRGALDHGAIASLSSR